VEPYSLDGASASAALILDSANSVIEQTVNRAGGVLLTLPAGSRVWSYPSIHGDIVITTDATDNLTGGPYRYDPYGNTTSAPDNSAGNMDQGWLGQHQ
jgi:hypothetical protein